MRIFGTMEIRLETKLRLNWRVRLPSILRLIESLARLVC